MVLKTTLIAFLGAVLCLDRLCLQVMVSRPIVVAPMIGWIIGDLAAGLLVGAFTELLWLDRPAIGNYVPPNESLVAVVITGAAVFAGGSLGGVTQALTVFALLVLLPLSYASQRMDIYLMAENNRLSDTALEDAKAGKAAAIERRHLWAIGRTFLAFVVFIFVFTLIGATFLVYTYPLLPSGALKALNLFHYAFPLLMIAVALNSIKLRGDILVFGLLAFVAVVFYEWIK